MILAQQLHINSNWFSFHFHPPIFSAKTVLHIALLNGDKSQIWRYTLSAFYIASSQASLIDPCRVECRHGLTCSFTHSQTQLLSRVVERKETIIWKLQTLSRLRIHCVYINTLIIHTFKHINSSNSGSKRVSPTLWHVTFLQDRLTHIPLTC